MNEPDWIEEPVVLALHLDQLKAFGGLAGVRDRGLLLSALGRAQNAWAYSSPKPDIVRLAASYTYGLVKNHPFLDGNKRTSLIVCHTFLRMNGWELRATQAEKAQIILDVAAGASGESELEAWLRAHAFPIPQAP
jgi:death-on-curing protein